MGDIRVISDPHLGHKQILNFCPDRGGTDVQSHSEWIVHQWNSVVSKRDHVYVLGDICFDRSHLKYLKQMRGQKTMIWGNHDKFSLNTYLNHFHIVRGFFKKHGFFWSHAPIHPGSLRNLRNIHGHTHQYHVQTSGWLGTGFARKRDNRYINVTVDVLDGKPIKLNDIKARFPQKGQ